MNIIKIAQGRTETWDDLYLYLLKPAQQLKVAQKQVIRLASR